MSFRFSLRLILILVAVAAILCAVFTDPLSRPAVPDGLFVQSGRAGKPRVAFRRKDNYGFLDERGRVAIPPQFTWADDFRAGFALVHVNRQPCIIDEGGAVVGRVPAKAESYFRASDDRVWFQVGDQWGLADLQGNVLLKPTYHDVDRFSGPYARVNLGAKLEFPGFMEGGKSGYVDGNGKVVVPVTLEAMYCRGFNEGHAVVGDQLIDRTGRIVLERRGLGVSLSDGLIPVRNRDNGTEYLDASGTTKFKTSGDGDDFSEGLARVRSGDKIHYVDPQGKVVFKCEGVEAAEEFHHGLAAVRVAEDQWGFMDRTGRIVTPTHFNEVKPAGDKFLIVHFGGQMVLIMDAPNFWEGGRWLLTDRSGRPLAVLREDQGDW